MKVIRFGFPVVPDFGGTAHAYCGTTMDAALGDLLSWELKPRLEDMLKAYITKSRVKQAQHLMLSQSYSPHVFRQGLLPGPALLRDVLTKKKTPLQAKRAWTASRTEDAKTKGKKPYWLTSQTLPCRSCSDAMNGGRSAVASTCISYGDFSGYSTTRGLAERARFSMLQMSTNHIGQEREVAGFHPLRHM